MKYIDKQGNEITLEEWLVLLEDDDYRQIVQHYLGDFTIFVSTVWIGLAYEPEAPYYVFETMVFGGPWDEHAERHASEHEALVWHEYVLAEHLILGWT